MLKKICLLSIVVVAAVLFHGAGTWGDDGFYVIATKGPQGPPGASLNPLQIALLRWYGANTNGPNYPLDSNPNGIAFDGANIWVANNGSTTVSKR